MGLPKIEVFLENQHPNNKKRYLTVHLVLFDLSLVPRTPRLIDIFIEELEQTTNFC